MDILNFQDLKIKRNKFASRSANLPRSKRQILLAGLQQIGLFTLAGAADI